MSKYKFVSYLFVLLGLLVIAGSSYVIISYASDILTAIVDFVTTNDYTNLRECGVTPPTQFNKVKSDLTTVILPSLYLGLPVLLIILSFLMFLAGFYYHRGRHETEEKKIEEMERNMVHKLVKKVEAERASSNKVVTPKVPMKAEETGEETEDEDMEEESEEEPPPKAIKRKR